MARKPKKKKNYIYHEHLQFLLAAQEPSETKSSVLIDSQMAFSQINDCADITLSEEDQNNQKIPPPKKDRVKVLSDK